MEFAFMTWVTANAIPAFGGVAALCFVLWIALRGRSDDADRGGPGSFL